MIISPSFNYNIQTHCIQCYYLKSFQEVRFNTDDFIYEIENDKIYKFKHFNIDHNVNINDSLSFYLKNDSLEKILVYHVPINATYTNNRVDKYKLNQNSLLTLYIEENKKFYFHTNETNVTHSIKDDMITFLSLLKLYN